MSWWMKLILIAALVIGGYAFYRGYWDVHDVRSGARRGLGAVKKTAGLKPNIQRGPGNAEACRQNLKALESAKRQIAERHGTISVSWEEVRKHFPGGVLPKCPDGGEYQLNGTGQVATCSIGNNETIDRADDHHISGF